MLGQKFRVQFADGCAWRALYVFRPQDTSGFNRWYDVQVFRLGIDPVCHVWRSHWYGRRFHKAEIFGAIGNWSWRVPVPAFLNFLPWWKLDGRNAYYEARRNG